MSMTVKALIERLRLFPDEQEVRVAVENPYGTEPQKVAIEKVGGFSHPLIILEP